MKSLTAVCALACIAAGSAGAESLCDRAPDAALLAELAGDWSGPSEIWIEAETVSTGDKLDQGPSVLEGSGAFFPAFLADLSTDPVMLAGAEPYTVDQVDDFLDTTGSDWMADALSDTPCGPETLPQFSGAVDLGPDLTGQVAVIGYFADRVLVIMDLQTRGDWGFAEVTVSSLLTRGD